MNKEKRYTLVVEQRLYDALGTFAKASGLTKIDACATLLERGLKSIDHNPQEITLEDLIKYYIDLPENKKRRFNAQCQILEQDPDKKQTILKNICLTK